MILFTSLLALLGACGDGSGTTDDAAVDPTIDAASGATDDTGVPSEVDAAMASMDDAGPVMAFQATADGRRLRPLLPDRQMLP